MKSKKNNNPLLLEILRTFARNPVLTAAVLLVLAGAVIVSLLPPLFLGDLIDDITKGQAITFARIFIYYLLLAAAGILEFMQEGLLVVLGQKITHGLRSRLSHKLSRLSADSLSRQEPGAVVSRFVGDVDTVEELFTSGIISMFADACKIIGIFAIICSKSMGLSILLCFVVPVIFLFTRHVQKAMLTAHITNRAAVNRISNHVPETIRCIRTIQNLEKEDYMEAKYDGYIEESYAAIEKTNFYDAIYSPVILIINALVVAIVMIFSASNDPVVLSLFGMSVGTSVAIINYISQIFSPIESLGMEIQTIQSALAGVHRINEFLRQDEEKPKAEHSDNDCNLANVIPDESADSYGKTCCELPNEDLNYSCVEVNSENYREHCLEIPNENYNSPCVELDHVSFGYTDQMVFNNMNLTVYPGEQVTLVGKTGAGKSTIFKLLLGLYSPNSGRVSIEGREASSIPDSGKRRLFGYVEQKFHLVPGNIKDQITLYDPFISMDMVKKAAKLAGLSETIEELEEGYETPCSPDIFSQGQWQLLSIARAVAANPKILLLDEITASLDADTEAHVLKAIANAAQGRTVISISHRLNYATGSGKIQRMVNIGA